jgi:hypothetical protein
MIKNKQHHLALLAQLIGANGFNLSDKGMLQKAIETFVNESHRQYGFRIQNMFAYVAGALGKCLLVKQEDIGICLSAEKDIGIPDYYVAITDSSAFFVEVKNCSEMYIKFSEEYVKKLSRYAAIRNIPLKMAIYWYKIRHWTLNPVENFEFKDGCYKLPLGVAMATSEMAILGDLTIGTLAPLKLRLMMDPKETTEIDEKGNCQFTIGKIEIYCQDTLIEDEDEKNIAFKLIMSGKWKEIEDVIIVNGKVISIDYTYSPIGSPTNNYFSIIASLSSIISSSYDDSTISYGKIQKLLPEAEPYLFEVPIPENYKGKYLPLWRLSLKPNPDFKSNT